MKHINKPSSEKKTRVKSKKEKKESLEDARRQRDIWLNQLLDTNHPPEVRAAYERMIKLGYDEEYTRQRILTVFTFPRIQELATNEPFDFERFIRMLNALPYISPEEKIKGIDMESFDAMNARGED